MNKSQFACQQTLSRFRDSYLWTFTFREVLPVREAVARWHILQKSLTRLLDFEGVRVFEFHPGGHGVHVHVVTARRYEVTDVRPIAESAGFGRIHVESTDNPDYVSKYVTKSGRDGWPKGTRLWATFGKLPRTRVRDVQVDSLGSDIYHSLLPWIYVPVEMNRVFLLYCYGCAAGRYAIRSVWKGENGVDVEVNSIATGELVATFSSHITLRNLLLIRRPWDWV